MTDLTIREARADDLEAIIRLHEEDELGSHGDLWSAETRPAYEAAFAAIARSAENRLFVALDGEEVVGTFQLTFIPNLTGRGALRVKVESVKVKAARRSGGIGARMIVFAEGYAREQGAPGHGAHVEQDPQGRASLLRAPGLRPQPRGVQEEAVRGFRQPAVIPAQAGIHNRDGSRNGERCAGFCIVSGYGSRAPLTRPRDDRQSWKPYAFVSALSRVLQALQNFGQLASFSSFPPALASFHSRLHLAMRSRAAAWAGVGSFFGFVSPAAWTAPAMDRAIAAAMATLTTRFTI